MIPELGTFAIILAFLFSLLQIGSGAYRYRHPHTLVLPKTAALAQGFFLLCAMACLILSLISNDVTVIYVREHSHPSLPLLYRIGAAWGGHEGSLLLWCLILAGWTAVFIFANQTRIIPALRAAILMNLGLISCGFLLFLLLTSNPFLRDFPTLPVSAADLTPLLQDPGLLFHPPILYSGYVGTAVAFAFAMAALWYGEFPPALAHALRPWVLLPWAFLGCGIVAGSWWAYRELGWGGWWFWDPVENASLLPWLATTALLHSLIVTQKRQTFAGWSILLAMLAFSLSLIGTFLVRSGVLVSVHAFATDPARGIFLLIFLTLLAGGSLLLYGLRIVRFYRPVNFALVSRETFLLFNTILLLTAVVTILTGTLYPIILDALNLGKISVGEPYFNTLFTPLMLIVLLFMGVAPHMHWQHYALKKLSAHILFPLLISCIVIASFPWLTDFQFHFMASLGIAFASWVIAATIVYLWQHRHAGTLSHIAMAIAHIGIAILALGVTINKTYSAERQLRIAVGDTTTLAGYTFDFIQQTRTAAENYTSLNAIFTVKYNGKMQGTITTSQRTFVSHNESLSHPGILWNGWRDLYIASGNVYTNGSWAIRIYYRPLVRWIWLGGLLTVLGGLFALLNAYFQRRKKAC